MPEKTLDIRKNKTALMGVAVGLTLVTLLSGRVVGPLATSLGVDAMMTRTVTRAVISVIAMVALGAGRWLIPDVQKIRDAWFYARPLILINLVLAVIAGSLATLLLLFLGEFTGAQLMSFAYLTVLCIFVGINEEAMFRGLMFGGLLAGIGGRRGGALWAAVISSVAFGFVHVMFDVNYTDSLSIAQGVLKTLETGLFGFILCVSVLEGRNIVGAMTVHAFFDWVVMIKSALDGSMPTATYVSTDQTVAFAAIAIYVVLSLLYLPKTIESVKRLKAMPAPQYGPFVPEAESAKLVNSARKERQEALSQLPTNASPAHLRRERAHKVLDHKVATIFVTLLVFIIVSNSAGLLGLLVFGSGTAAQMVTAVGTVAGSMLILLGYQRMFAGQFDGMTAWSTPALVLALPGLLLGVANIFDWPGATFNNPLVCLILAMAPGFSEEIVFRAIPVSNWMRTDADARSLAKAAVVTSAVFGLIHVVNLIAGAALSATLFQVFYAFCLGILFSAVLLRTGCIWPCIIVHAFIDFLSFLTTDMNAVGVLSTAITLNFETGFVIVVSIGLIVWAAYLLRPAKHAEIAALWKEKWHRG